MLQAEADVDSLMEQASQAETKNRSPFKRRAGLSDEEMGERSIHALPFYESVTTFFDARPFSSR